MFKPTTFGKFFLYEKLAIGGMAEIFKAKLYGIAGFEKTLVVKQILPEYASDSEFVKMFIDEANIAVSLTHGNIVPVYELGKIAERYYIAMEYVDGENLETILDESAKARREIPVHLAVEIVIEVCKGLDYAHRKTGADGISLGIVHRDVSPQNVMVSFDGEVKIVDFGIAKAASKLSLTRVGTLKGKFGYMSPEQAMGREVDSRTDVYAAGIVLYESLTGKKLFDAPNDLDLLQQVRAGIVAPPSTVNRRIPVELDRLMLKGLAKDSAARYQHASEFQMDLQRWLYSRPAAADEETMSSYMRGLFRRERPVATPVPPPPFLTPFPPPFPPPVVTVEDDASRRDAPFAQSSEISKVLVDASLEARRVMGDTRGGERTHPPESSAGAVARSKSFGSPFDEGPGSDETRTSSVGSDDVIEFDETTNDVLSRLGPESRVERPTVEGPIVRIPSYPRRARVAPPPPWANVPVAPAPPPFENHDRTAQLPVARGKGTGTSPRELGGANGAPVSDPDSSESERLFPASSTRPAAFPWVRLAAAGLVVAAIVAAFGAAVRGAKAGRGGKASPPAPIAGGASPHVSGATSPAGIAAGTAVQASATPGSSAATPIPEPTATRRVTFETFPSGAAVFLGAKKLGTTPLTVSVTTEELSVRFSKPGFRDLRRSYSGGSGTLKVVESLDSSSTRLPPPEPGSVRRRPRQGRRGADRRRFSARLRSARG